MPSFVSGLPAVEVADRLRKSLSELDRARENVALWFADVVERRLWRDLGHSSVYQFAAVELGFSTSRTTAHLRIARSMAALPRLRSAVRHGELGWSKAHVVARVATPDTEQAWVEQARTQGRRELERRARLAVGRTMAAAAVAPQVEMAPPGSGPAFADPKEGSESRGETGSRTGAPSPAAPVPGIATSEPDSDARESSAIGVAGGKARGGVTAPGTPAGGALFGEPPSPPAAVTVTLRFSAEQYAAHEALLAKLRRTGIRKGVEETVLRALGVLLETGAESAGVSMAPAQVVVAECPTCRSARVPTTRGDLPLDPVSLDRLRCQARESRPGGRNTAAIPDSRRRRVLERDGYRCRGAGCGHRSFLEVHHVQPRSVGGSNREDNLVTLCSGCHQAIHRRERGSFPSTPGELRPPTA